MRLLLCLLLVAATASAGGGAETTLVVVNQASPISRRIANEYVALRRVPESHVVWLEGVPSLGVISLKDFRERIWAPIREFLITSQLDAEIDLVAYSAGFPYAVDLSELLKGEDIQEIITPLASITGCTFLHRRVEKNDLTLVDLHVSRYARSDFSRPRLTSRRLTPDERATFTKAMGAMMAGDLRAATREYERFLATYKTHPMSWFNYAVCLARARKPDEAVAALAQAVATGWNDVKKTETAAAFASFLRRLDFQRVLDDMRERVGKIGPAQGFSSRFAWTADGGPDTHAPLNSLDRYRLSVLLGYTGVRGNSVPEVLAYLQSSASSDGSNPKGTVYLCNNVDVRARPRDSSFEALKKAMREYDRPVEILQADVEGKGGQLPQGREDVLGVVAGIPRFDWRKSRSRILPGAICEHLTSFGGAFLDRRETKLSEWLRHGAAGSSGTVGEGFFIHQKFPHAFLHRHYAEGCSLAEAFYLSVAAPYQLLVVGDPLARPFAFLAQVRVVEPSGPWRGTVPVAFEIKESDEGPIGGVELWVDGRRLADTSGDKPIPLDTTKLDDGVHMLRVVAVEAGRIETRSAATCSFVVANHGRLPTLSGPVKPVVFGSSIALKGKAPGATSVELCQGARILETAKPSKKTGFYRFSLASDRVGPGPVSVYVKAGYEDGAAARSAPVSLIVTDPEARPAPGKRALLPGVDARVDDKTVLVASLNALPDAKRIEFSGFFEVAQAGFGELCVEARGTLTLSVGDSELCKARKFDGLIHLPVALGAGAHPMRLEFVPQGKFKLDVVLAGASPGAPLKLGRAEGSLLPRPRARKNLRVLVDGNRRGKARPVNKGVELTWERAVKGLSSVVLFPTRWKDEWPDTWVVETTIGRGWRAVSGLEVVTLKPFYQALRFKPVLAEGIRIRAASGNVRVHELEFYAR